MQWSEENRELKETVRSGTFDESAFEKDEDEVEAVIGVPTSLQVVLTCLVSFLQTGTNLIPLKKKLLVRLKWIFFIPDCFLFKISAPGAPLKTCVSAHHRCVCIIDCFEMFTERTWKQEHKHTWNTNIAIQWNTKLAGRSDKHVTEQSGFLDSLSTGGVTLTESFRLHNPELRIPASSKEKT